MAYPNSEFTVLANTKHNDGLFICERCGRETDRVKDVEGFFSCKRCETESVQETNQTNT